MQRMWENYHYWIFEKAEGKSIILLKRSLHWREEEH